MRFNEAIAKDFSGCISVKKHGKVVLQESYGYADYPNKIKNEISTKFATASAGKVFVAVGILQLIEKNMIHFDDTIGKILDFDLKEIDKNITIRQLLSHT